MMNAICQKYNRNDFQKKCVGPNSLKFTKEDKFYQANIPKNRKANTKHVRVKRNIIDDAENKIKGVGKENLICGGAAIGSAIVGLLSACFLAPSTMKVGIVTIAFAACTFFTGWLVKEYFFK